MRIIPVALDHTLQTTQEELYLTLLGRMDCHNFWPTYVTPGRGQQQCHLIRGTSIWTICWLHIQYPEYLVDHRLINDRQYSFRHGRICDFRMYITHGCTAVCSYRKQGRGPCSLDMDKAFDRVWHEALLQNFHSTGFLRMYVSVSPAFSLGATSRSLSMDFYSEILLVNADVLQGCVRLLYCFFWISMTCCLILTYIAKCFHLDSTTNAAVYSGPASLSRNNIDQCRNKLVPSFEESLRNVSLWG